MMKSIMKQMSVIMLGAALLIFLAVPVLATEITASTNPFALTMDVTITTQDMPPDWSYAHGIGMRVLFYSCELTSVSISAAPDCAGGVSANCEQGEHVRVSASYAGICPSPALIQVNASDVLTPPPNPSCKILHSNGNMQGIDVSCAGSDCVQFWEIPFVPQVCKGKTIFAANASMYHSNIAQENLSAIRLYPSGQFTLANDGAPPCVLNSVTITPQCAGGLSPDCEPGEKIRIAPRYSSSCPNPSLIQVNARSTDGNCDIEHVAADMIGMDGSCTDGTTCSFDWTIPTYPPNCYGKTVTTHFAGLYHDAIENAKLLSSLITATSFKLQDYPQGCDKTFIEDFNTTEYEDLAGTHDVIWDTFEGTLYLVGGETGGGLETVTTLIQDFGTEGGLALYNNITNKVYFIFGDNTLHPGCPGGGWSRLEPTYIYEYNPNTQQVVLLKTLAGVRMQWPPGVLDKATNRIIWFPRETGQSYINTYSITTGTFTSNPINLQVIDDYWDTCDNPDTSVSETETIATLDEQRRAIYIITNVGDGYWYNLDTGVLTRNLTSIAPNYPVGVAGSDENRGSFFKDGKIYYFTRNGEVLAYYDPITRAKGTIPVVKDYSQSSLVYLPDENVMYTFGGALPGYLRSIYKYDFSTSVYGLMPEELPADTEGSSAVYNTRNHLIYILGGRLEVATGQDLLEFSSQRTPGTTTGTAQSLAIYTAAEDLQSANLVVEETVPSDTDITYYLSADNGIHWQLYTPGIPADFQYPGRYLKWKAVLTTTNDQVTPVLSRMDIFTNDCPCNLDSVTFSINYCTRITFGNMWGCPRCCAAGNDIEFTASYSGNCPNPAYIQVNASNYHSGSGFNSCFIQPWNENPPGHMVDILGMNFSCTQSPCIANWTVPTYPTNCFGARMYINESGIYRDSFIRVPNLVTVHEANDIFFHLSPAGCGDGMIEPTENCDGNPGDSFWDWGYIDSCEDLGFDGGILSCFSFKHPQGCYFNTSGCFINSPPGGFCGNGVLDDGLNESCDGNPGDPVWTWGNVTGCWDFGFSGGNLSCNGPASNIFSCLFDTSNCRTDFFQVNMNCGNINYNRAIGGSWPLNTIACNDTLQTSVPYDCNTPGDCVYIDEYTNEPGPPPFRCFYNGQNWTRNYANKTITCNGVVNGVNYNTWCPANFHYDPAVKLCVINDEVNDELCDASKMYGKYVNGSQYTNYSANCSLSPGIPGNWTLNASQSYECLKPQDPGLQWPLWNPPDTV
ncbi:MAG: hypothetical protein V1743_07890, partial [Nanoarchaeota archaeon]